MIFVLVILLIAVVFTSGINSGVRGCETFTPFSKNTVALAGVFTTVAFVTFRAVAELTRLCIANNNAKVVTPKIKK